jgi:PTH1 family peptidyl-tRNA hydrolase
MPLLVGLGNPGSKYDHTRHNVGFALADSTARAVGAEDNWKTWGAALLCKAALGPLSLLIAKPQTFMNLSGEAVQALLTFYKLHPSDMAVVSDDVTLPIGSVRIRTEGGHGGHNGLRDIISRIGEGFPRIRIGVGPCPPNRDLSNFVLGKIDVSEQELLSPIFKDFPGLVEMGFTKGWDLAASRFNRRNDAGSSSV